MTEGNDGIVQFIVYAEDPGKAAAFYEAVFGWKTSALHRGDGGSHALIIDNPGGHRRVLRGHIETRNASEAITGFECIVSVASLAKVTAAVRANGGTVLHEVPFIATVGGFLRFRDPDGNVVQAFQFENEQPRAAKATSNKRMQLTRSAKAKRRRGPRS